MLFKYFFKLEVMVKGKKMIDLIFIRICKRLVSKMRVCFRMNGFEFFRYVEILGMYLFIMIVYRM